jgi:hypothetical protein
MGNGDSPLRWCVLMLAALAVSSSYYESDIIGPIADLRSTYYRDEAYPSKCMWLVAQPCIFIPASECPTT